MIVHLYYSGCDTAPCVSAISVEQHTKAKVSEMLIEFPFSRRAFHSLIGESVMEYCAKDTQICRIPGFIFGLILL